MVLARSEIEVCSKGVERDRRGTRGARASYCLGYKLYDRLSALTF